MFGLRLGFGTGIRVGPPVRGPASALPAALPGHHPVVRAHTGNDD